MNLSRREARERACGASRKRREGRCARGRRGGVRPQF